MFVDDNNDDTARPMHNKIQRNCNAIKRCMETCKNYIETTTINKYILTHFLTLTCERENMQNQNDTDDICIANV